MTRCAFGILVSCVVLGAGWSSLPRALADDRAAGRSFPLPKHTVLRLARSHDGLGFSDTGRVLAVGAGSPDLTVLPNGDLIAIFDLSVGRGHDVRSVPVVVRSKDQGRRWSAPRRVRLRGGGRTWHANHLDLVRVPGGGIRLFFAVNASRRGGRDVGARVLSAVTRDGTSFRVEGGARSSWSTGSDVYPVAGWVGKRLNVMVGVFGASRWLGSDRLVATRAGQLGKPVPVTMEGVQFVGSMIPTQTGARAYVTTASGIHVLDTKDGVSWTPIPEAHMPEGWDAGVVQLGPDSFLMAYCTLRDEEPLALVHDNRVDDTGTDAGGDGAWDEASEPLVLGEPEIGTKESVVVVAPEAEKTSQMDNAEEPTRETVERIESEGAAAPMVECIAEPVVLMADFGIDDGNLDGYDPALTGGFAPKPGFDHKVSYAEWYKEYALGHEEDNAAEAYAAFMPGSRADHADMPEWPVFNDMYNSGEFDGPPMPWDPKDHPEWEATSEAAAGLFEKYRAAAQHRGFARKFETGYNPNATSTDAIDGVNADERDLLIGILLPDLSSHRTLAKAILADAWRAPGGKVSPERMRAAIDTTLRVANHMYQGSTLIEDLVGTAIERLATNNARWALRRGVFSPDEMGAVLATLQARNPVTRSLSGILGGEHAFAMDFTQHLFTPPTVNGEPHFNRERGERALAWWNEPDKVPALVERTSQMSPDDVYTSLEVLDNYYRDVGKMMRIGYPQVRADDIAALEQRTVHTSPLTENILPSLSRYYELTTRSLADRRATQVTFATEIFNEEHGRYPASLDELPTSGDGTMTIDPFTGEPFGYKLTEAGPRIYSLSENGIDDGGSHSPRWGDRGGNEAGSDDYVFWPPQR